jgi:hypothetical protein
MDHFYMRLTKIIMSVRPSVRPATNFWENHEFSEKTPLPDSMGFFQIVITFDACIEF